MALARVLAWSLAEFLALAAGCTYFEIPDGNDGKRYVLARSMEYSVLPLDLTDWVMVTHPVQEEYLTADKYGRSVSIGHVSVDIRLPDIVRKYAPHALNAAIDGMNERGLSVSANILKSSRYGNFKFSDFEDLSKVLWFGDLPRWALANFETAAEVASALKSMNVISAGLPSKIFGLHWAVADRFGHSIVIEYLDGTGKPTVYNNTVRVLTNDPDYPWQVRNLDNYAVLTPNEPAGAMPIEVSTDLFSPYDKVPAAVSNGANLKGLPGDTLPTSRFVSVFYVRGFARLNAPPCGNAVCTMVLAQAILNKVFIPRGVEAKSATVAFTQWDIIKLPHSRTFMYRSYVNMGWKSVDMSKLNLGDPNTKSRRVGIEDYNMSVVDFTSGFAGDGDGVPDAAPGSFEEPSVAAPTGRRLHLSCDLLAVCGPGSSPGSAALPWLRSRWLDLALLAVVGSACFACGRYGRAAAGKALEEAVQGEPASRTGGGRIRKGEDSRVLMCAS